MLIALAAAAVILAQAAATPAPEPPAATSAPTIAPATVKPPKPKLICHDEIVTGSIMSKRVCRTREQIEADRQQAQRDNDALSDHLAACHGASC